MLTTPRWYPGFIVGTVFLTLALVWAPAGLGMARSRRLLGRGAVAVGAAAVVLLAVVLGRAQEVQYFKHHYTRTTLFLQDGGPRDAFEFAHNLEDKRIGIAGSGEIFFGQYGFYGKNLNNYVAVHRRARGRTGPTVWRPAAANSAAGSTRAITTT